MFQQLNLLGFEIFYLSTEEHEILSESPQPLQQRKRRKGEEWQQPHQQLLGSGRKTTGTGSESNIEFASNLHVIVDLVE